MRPETAPATAWPTLATMPDGGAAELEEEEEEEDEEVDDDAAFSAAAAKADSDKSTFRMSSSESSESLLLSTVVADLLKRGMLERPSAVPLVEHDPYMPSHVGGPPNGRRQSLFELFATPPPTNRVESSGKIQAKTSLSVERYNFGRILFITFQQRRMLMQRADPNPCLHGFGGARTMARTARTPPQYLETRGKA